MNSGAKVVIGFLVGGASGFMAGKYYYEKKYNDISKQEIAEMETYYKQKEEELRNKENDLAKDKGDFEKKKLDISSYANILNAKEYTEKIEEPKKEPNDISDVEGPLPKEVEIAPAIREKTNKRPRKPFVISPDDFGLIDDFEQITLEYYADGILADEDQSIIENVEDLVGFDSLSHFGEYEDDCVCVRNERYRVDYEILRNNIRYADLMTAKYPMEG